MRLLLASLLLASLSAHADSVADEADFHFHRGATLIRQGNLEEALSEFLGSNRLVRNHNTLFNIARCFELLHKSNEAYRWYGDLLVDESLPEADRKAVENALERLRPSLALLRIETTPPGATVFIDRKDLGARGQTPVTLALPPGNVLALVELVGFKPAQAAAALAVGKTATVSLSPERIYGTIVLAGEPQQAEAQIDRATAQRLPASGPLKMVPGDHLVFITAPGYVAQQLSVQVPAAGAVPVRFNLLPLPPPSGTLVVRANVDGALLRLDGREAGFTPDVIKNVAAGQHHLEIAAEGRETFAQEVAVAENERAFVDARLSYLVPRVEAAERQLTRAEDAPASVTLISAAEIRGFGYTTLAQALRSVRGLYTTSDRTYESFGVRGFSPPGVYNDKVLVLSDGHVTNDVSSGQGFIGHDFDVDLDDVERIEVVRGPGSVLYGSAAFFAVVNVVHRSAASGAHFDLGTQLGSLNESAGHLGASAGNERAAVSARVAALRSDGESVFAAPERTGPATRFATNLDGEDAEHGELRAHAGDFSLSAAFNRRNKSIATGPFQSFGLAGAANDDQRSFIEAAYSHTADSGFGVDARLSEDAARSTHDIPLAQTSDLERATRAADWTSGELRLRLPAFAGNRAFVGGEVQDLWRTTLALYQPNQGPVQQSHRQLIASGYLGDDLRLGRRVQLDAAVRLDGYVGRADEALPGPQLHPRLALIVQPWDTGTLKLMAGTAYRAPTLNERYFHSGRQLQAEGTPDERGKPRSAGGVNHLLPENVRTGEFEYTHQLAEDVTAVAAGYWSRIDQIIRLKAVTLTDGEKGFRFQNKFAQTFSGGLEGEVRWAPRPDALLAFWYSYNRIANNNENPDVPNAPRHTGALRALLPLGFGRFSLSTELIYNSARIAASDDPTQPSTNVGEALTWNVGVSGQYAPWHLRYGAFAEDLLDERVLLPGGLEIPFPNHAVPQLGRTIRVQLASSF
jgi:outer membrane receptor protein involved in Fe transport